MRHCALAAALLLAPTILAADQAEIPAARVNGVAIERDAVQELVKGLARAERKPPDSKRIAELNKSALASLIDLELLYQEAVRSGVELKAGEVDREIARLRQHFASEKEFEDALAKRDLSTARLRSDTRRTLLADRLLQRTVWRGLSVGSDEVDAFYYENRDQLDQPFEELQDSIARMLLDEKKAAKRAELLAKLRKRATIEKFPPFAPPPAKQETASPEPTPAV